MSLSEIENVDFCAISDAFIFDSLPVELKLMIFKLLDLDTFITCRLVSKDWKEIIDTIKDDNVWKYFLYNNFSTKYRSYARKSKLPYYKLFKNIAAWNKPTQVTIAIGPSNGAFIINMHVYKDNLIVIYDDCVMYLNTENFKVKKFIKKKYKDLNESDHMIVILKRSDVLLLYGKAEGRNWESNQILPSVDHQDITVYKLEDDKCYFVTDNRSVFVCEWNNLKWKQTFLAKYQGNDTITDINIFDKEIHVITTYCKVYKVVLDEKRLDLCFSVTVVELLAGPFMFDKYSFGYAVCPQEDIVDISEDSGFITIGQQDLTCLLQHGDIIILGHACGRIDLFSFKSVLGSDRFRPLQITTIPHGKNIRAIDIYENENSHFLYLLTDDVIMTYIFTFS